MKPAGTSARRQSIASTQGAAQCDAPLREGFAQSLMPVNMQHGPKVVNGSLTRGPGRGSGTSNRCTSPAKRERNEKYQSTCEATSLIAWCFPRGGFETTLRLVPPRPTFS